MNREQIIAGFFFILFLFVLYQLFLVFSPFLKSIFWAGILAFIFYPLYKEFLSLAAGHRTLAAVSTTLLVLVIVLPIAAVIGYSLAEQGIKLYDLVSGTLTVAAIKEWIVSLRSFAPIEQALNAVLASEDLQSNLTQYILNTAKFIGNYATAILAETTKNILLVLIQILLTIFVLFFFFRDGDDILAYIKELLPMDRKHKTAVFDKISETLSAVIRGQFVTSFIQGTVAGFVFWLLGTPIPIFFGFLTFLTSMIPILGAACVWVPFVIYFLVIKAFGKALILFLVGTFFISLLDNLLKPLLIGEKTKLPVLLLFFGILGGLRLYGLTGIFLGPVIIALFFALIKIYQAEYMGVKR